ncbi:tumor necrosis factor receptor superfamily member 27 [Rhinophrynus dorsalis]
MKHIVRNISIDQKGKLHSSVTGRVTGMEYELATELYSEFADHYFPSESNIIHNCSQCGLILMASADCQESEFVDEQGNCIPCKQCGPGQELSEDCGSARDLQCIPCRAGRYKEDRGHQRCLRCLPCHVINRVLKANCTPTTNSVCGDCLPGFYSKTRIGGLQELECFPCTSHTPPTESQCHPRLGPSHPVSTASPPRDQVVLVAVIAVALALILVALVILSVICCGRFFKSQCHRAFQRSQDFAGQPGRLTERQGSTNSPCEGQPIPACCFGSPKTCQQVQCPVEDVRAISDRGPTNSTACNALSSRQPSVELCAVPPAPVKPHYNRSVSETQPLIRNSGCSDCFSSCGPNSDPSPVAAEPQGTAALSCATERQHWSHAPVECTELDLQNFSTEDGLSASAQTHSGRIHRALPAQSPHTCICMDIAQSGYASPTQEVPTSANGPKPPQAMTCDDFVSRMDRVNLDVSISHIPNSLVVSLSHKLDPSISGLKDFRDVGLALGVSATLIDSMEGFEVLHCHLSTSSSCTLLQLVQTLQKLQRWDALCLICKHFGQ